MHLRRGKEQARQREAKKKQRNSLSANSIPCVTQWNNHFSVATVLFMRNVDTNHTYLICSSLKINEKCTKPEQRQWRQRKNCTGIFFSPPLLPRRNKNEYYFDCLVSNAHEETTKKKQLQRRQRKIHLPFFSTCVNSLVSHGKENPKYTHKEVSVSFSYFLLSLQVEKQSKLSVLKMVATNNCIIHLANWEKEHNTHRVIIDGMPFSDNQQAQMMKQNKQIS